MTVLTVPGAAWQHLSIEVAHAVPGRFRLRFRGLRRQPKLAEQIAASAAAHPAVRRVRVNAVCSSIVVEYDRLAHPDLDVKSIVAAWKSGTGSPAGVRSRASGGGRSLVLALAGAAVSLFGGPVVQGIAGALTAAAAVPMARRALASLRQRRTSVEQLDSAAVTGLLALGNVRGAAVMTALVALGDEIRERTARRSRRAAIDLAEALGRRAWVVRGDRRRRVAVADLRPGDTVVVYPGELIPVDGVVVSGRAAVDQKMMTGEAMPVAREEGMNVLAGTTIADGKLYVRAEATGASTRAGSIVRLLDAPTQDTRAASYANNVGDRLVLPTFGIAAAVMAITRNAAVASAILMVDLATGIRIAAPTSVMATIARAAKDGVLIKGGRALEQLATVDAIVFDKTGTLTIGEPEVTGVASFNDHRPDELLRLAAGAEVRLRHPAAKAVVRYAEELGVEIPPRGESEYSTGLGVEARIDGHQVLVGSQRFLETRRIEVPQRVADERSSAGESYLYVAIDDEPAGIVRYRDPPRPESTGVLRALRDLGIGEILMVSGDEVRTAEAVGAELGIDRVHAGALPDDKVAIVRDLQARGRRVAVIGDGINDAAALAQADASIAVRHGADIARETADVVLMEPDLRAIPHAILLARQCLRIIGQDIAIVAAPNAVAMGLGVIGRLDPLTATILNNGSGIVAALNSLRPLRSAPAPMHGDDR